MLSDGKNTVQAKQWFDKCYSDSVTSETMVKSWYADFKHGRIDTNDAEHSGHPNLVVVLENIRKLHKRIFGKGEKNSFSCRFHMQKP